MTLAARDDAGRFARRETSAAALLTARGVMPAADARS
jgi:hypothetical protein